MGRDKASPPQRRKRSSARSVLLAVATATSASSAVEGVRTAATSLGSAGGGVIEAEPEDAQSFAESVAALRIKPSDLAEIDRAVATAMA